MARPNGADHHDAPAPAAGAAVIPAGDGHAQGSGPVARTFAAALVGSPAGVSPQAEDHDRPGQGAKDLSPPEMAGIKRPLRRAAPREVWTQILQYQLVAEAAAAAESHVSPTSND